MYHISATCVCNRYMSCLWDSGPIRAVMIGTDRVCFHFRKLFAGGILGAEPSSGRTGAVRIAGLGNELKATGLWGSSGLLSDSCGVPVVQIRSSHFISV